MPPEEMKDEKKDEKKEEKPLKPAAKQEEKPKEEMARQTNCPNDNKPLKGAKLYYRNGNHFCSKGCFKAWQAKQGEAPQVQGAPQVASQGAAKTDNPA
ncbi:MAG: hypothetical protein HYY14_04470 [Candidatus Omnitrophica bacterium]|nr:hypothetical protein [Candidatus Omnitrophota bacterium]